MVLLTLANVRARRGTNGRRWSKRCLIQRRKWLLRKSSRRNLSLFLRWRSSWWKCTSPRILYSSENAPLRHESSRIKSCKYNSMNLSRKDVIHGILFFRYIERPANWVPPLQRPWVVNLFLNRWVDTRWWIIDAPTESIKTREATGSVITNLSALRGAPREVLPT